MYSLCGLVVRVPACTTRGPGYDSRRYQSFWEVVGLKRGPLSRVSTIEELLGKNSSGSGLENREYGRGDPFGWPRNTLYPQKLALTSPTSSGRSVGIRLRTKATEFVCLGQPPPRFSRVQLRVRVPPVAKHWCRTFSTTWWPNKWGSLLWGWYQFILFRILFRKSGSATIVYRWAIPNNYIQKYNTRRILKIISVCKYCRCNVAVTLVRMRAEFVGPVGRQGRNLQTIEPSLRIWAAP
jgi:hypothetical protein